MKKVISAISAIVVTFFTGAITTVAETNEQYNYIIESEIANEEDITPYSIDSIKILDVPFCEQQKNYYCGPACVQQVAKYYGYNPTQSAIAESIGTETYGSTYAYDIVDYCNDNFPYSWDYYSKDDDFNSPSSMLGEIGYSLDCDKPVIANLGKLTTSNWLYNSGGHYVVCRGYVDDTTTNGHVAYIVDPWKKGHGISNGRYTVSSDKLYNVIYGFIG